MSDTKDLKPWEEDFGPSETNDQDTAMPWEEDFEASTPNAIPKELTPQDAAILRGAQQGLTMGFSDELAGKIGQGLESAHKGLYDLGVVDTKPSTMVSDELAQQGFTGDIGPTNTLDLYKQLRDEDRAKNAALKESNPIAFGAGELGGGLLGMKGIGMAGKAALPAEAIAGANLAKNAVGLGSKKLLPKMALGAAEAAPLMAAYGLGTSEKETLPEQLEEAGDMGKMGLVIGGALPVAGKVAFEGVPAAAKYIGQLPIVDDAIQVFKRSKAGEKFAGQVENVSNAMRDLAQDSFKTLKGVMSKKVKTRDDLLNKATEKGVKFDIKGRLESARKAILELPEDLPEEKAAKTKLLKLVDDHLMGMKQTEEVVQNVPIPGTSGALKQAEQMERAKILAQPMDEMTLAQSQDPEIAKMLSSGMGPDDIKQALADKINSQVMPTDIPGINAGVLSKGSNPIKSMPLGTQTEKEFQQVSKRVNSRGAPKTEMSPEEMKKLIQDFGVYTKAGGKFQGKAEEAKALALDLNQDFANMVETQGVPGFRKATSDLSDATTISEAMLSGHNPFEFLPSSDVQDVITKISKNYEQYANDPNAKAEIEKLIGGFTNPQSERVIKGLKELDPKAADDLQNAISSLSEKMRLTKATAGEIESTGDIKKLGGTLKSYTLRGAEAMGNVARAAEPYVKPVGNAISKTKDMLNKDVKQISKDFTSGPTSLLKKSPEDIEMLAQKLSQHPDPVARKYAETLSTANNKKGAGRNALLFALMQRPDFRKFAIEDED